MIKVIEKSKHTNHKYLHYLIQPLQKIFKILLYIFTIIQFLSEASILKTRTAVIALSSTEIWPGKRKKSCLPKANCKYSRLIWDTVWCKSSFLGQRYWWPIKCRVLHDWALKSTSFNSFLQNVSIITAKQVHTCYKSSYHFAVFFTIT